MTSSSDQHGLQIGLDLGGSKIEGILLGPGAKEWARYRIATPRDDYAATIATIVDLAATLMQGITASARIGIAVPGSISPVTGLMQNANSTWLNGRPFDRDLAAALSTPVRLANDANCFALSEAIDGAERMRRPYSGLSWEQDAAVASSSMGGCSTDHVALAENGATTRFPGPHPTNTPDPNVGAAAKGAWRRGFRVPAWLPIMPG
jgi:fructokinase